MALRSSLAHFPGLAHLPRSPHRASPGFVPPPHGVGLPFPSELSDRGGESGRSEDIARAKEKTCGLLEERVERGALDALTRLRDARRA